MCARAAAAVVTLNIFATMFSRISTIFHCSQPDSPLHWIGDFAYWGTDGCPCCAHVRLLVAGVLLGATLAFALTLVLV
ncbi:hypothetical protein R70211_06786 [Paraburkholderia domus]|uniref:Uncharacterized protein n=2 Tax=Paraburkholderia domus TaxID=2793075 RepID=A0A9N8N6H9_9BURK|nr:hypothetical protein R70211_06786 [Paraburkholderia domus]